MAQVYTFPILFLLQVLEGGVVVFVVTIVRKRVALFIWLYAFTVFEMCSFDFKIVYFFGYFPFNCVTPYHVLYKDVLQLRELANFPSLPSYYF